jgi:protein-tyrosine phosphatase
MRPVIDLHAHVLPGIDDGPGGMEESVELARAAERDGVRTLALTPHLRDDYPAVVPEELSARRDELARRLAEESCELELVTGGEVDIAWGQSAGAESLRLVSYRQAGTDLLVETPYGGLPFHFEEMLWTLRAQGFRALLAHPERNPTLQGDPLRLRRLVEQGVLVQITAASLAGPRGSRSRRFAAAAVSEGVAHVIASDAHGPATVVRAGLSQGVAAAAALDAARAQWMVTEAPAAILAGGPLPPPPPRARPPGMGRRVRSLLRRAGVQGSSPSRRRR